MVDEISAGDRAGVGGHSDPWAECLQKNGGDNNSSDAPDREHN